METGPDKPLEHLRKSDLSIWQLPNQSDQTFTSGTLAPRTQSAHLACDNEASMPDYETSLRYSELLPVGVQFVSYHLRMLLKALGALLESSRCFWHFWYTLNDLRESRQGIQIIESSRRKSRDTSMLSMLLVKTSRSSHEGFEGVEISRRHLEIFGKSSMHSIRSRQDLGAFNTLGDLQQRIDSPQQEFS